MGGYQADGVFKGKGSCIIWLDGGSSVTSISGLFESLALIFSRYLNCTSFKRVFLLMNVPFSSRRPPGIALNSLSVTPTKGIDHRKEDFISLPAISLPPRNSISDSHSSMDGIW